MAREICFRGKSKSTGEWVEGYYVGDNTIIPFNEVVYDLGCIDTSSSHECYPDTIGQFTGLYDKNGKEVWEGDVIHDTDSEGRDIIHYVTYRDAAFIGVLKGHPLFSHSTLTQSWMIECEKEVIGNIHDNPELLKDGRD